MRLKSSTLIKPIIGICIFYTLTRSFCASLLGNYAYGGFLLFMGLMMGGYFLTYKKQNVRLEKTRFFGGMFLYLIIVVVSLLISSHSSTYALFEYVFYAFFIFAVCFVLRFVSLSTLLTIYEIVGVLLSLEAIWEYSTGNILYRSYTDFQVIRRAYGLIGSPLTLGMVLACIALISFYRGRHDHKGHYIIGILSVAGMLCTQSRGPYVGLVVGLIATVYVDEKMKNKEAAKAFLKTVLKVIALIIIAWLIIRALAGYNENGKVFVERIQTILVWSESGTSNFTRVQRWQNALHIFEEYPILGYGVSSTGPHASTGIITESGLLKKLVETGIIGFSIYYLVYVSETLHNLGVAEKSGQKYVALCFGIIIAVFVENIIMQIVESAAVYLIFSISFGYLLVISRGGGSKN